MSAPVTERGERGARGDRELWSGVVSDLGLDEPPEAGLTTPIGQRRRRGFDPQLHDRRASVELVRDDEDILRWVYTPPFGGAGSGRRAYRSFHATSADVVQRFRFSELGANDVTTKLLELDNWLTPGQGMKLWSSGQLVDDPRPQIDSGPVLLLVHGTFSQSQMWFDELAATPQGQALLAQWESAYGAILAFNHPTLSVGAWSNAIDLDRALRGVKCPIDVVCHSRGGLVVSWLLRLQPVPIERVVFVGSPLVGTSLAAPDKLRAALDMLANYADAVALISKGASTVIPLAAGVAGLAKILGKVLKLGSGLPILDASIAMVPGVATQQAVSNNLDVRQLFADDWMRTPDMSGLGVAFQPDEVREPLWRFWRRFSNIGDQIKYGAAGMVFPGPNDLVVDVGSMFRLGERVDIPFKDLGVSATTHHTNYFRDSLVLSHLADTLRR